MASILPIGSRWRAQVRKRGQSIAKTSKTKEAAEAWAREKEVEIDKGETPSTRRYGGHGALVVGEGEVIGILYDVRTTGAGRPASWRPFLGCGNFHHKMIC